MIQMMPQRMTTQHCHLRRTVRSKSTQWLILRLSHQKGQRRATKLRMKQRTRNQNAAGAPAAARARKVAAAAARGHQHRHRCSEATPLLPNASAAAPRRACPVHSNAMGSAHMAAIHLATMRSASLARRLVYAGGVGIASVRSVGMSIQRDAALIKLDMAQRCDLGQRRVALVPGRRFTAMLHRRGPFAGQTTEGGLALPLGGMQGGLVPRQGGCVEAGLSARLAGQLAGRLEAIHRSRGAQRALHQPKAHRHSVLGKKQQGANSAKQSRPQSRQSPRQKALAKQLHCRVLTKLSRRSPGP
mmetsp:Transcript_66512/g.124052  ORF Transcript_66512/g.124052 Transcript_66512/m.124052 type:complete len:301 (+) Transcript_66512:3-905(+)